MKITRMLTCLLALLLAGMIGISACAETDLSALEAAVKAAETGLALAQSAVEAAGTVENDPDVKAAVAKLTTAEKELAYYELLKPENLSAIKEVKDSLANAEAKIVAEIAALDKNLAELLAATKNPDLALASIDAALAAANAAKAEAEAEQTKLDEKQAALAAAQAAANATADTLATKEQKLKLAEAAVTAAEETLNAAKEELPKLSKAVTDAQNEYDNGKEEFAADLDKSVQDAKDEEASLQAKYDAATPWSSEWFKYGAELSIAQGYVAVVEGNRENIIALYEAAYPYLAEALELAKAELKKAQDAIPGLEKDVSDAKTDLATAQSEYDTAKAANDTKQDELAAAQTALDAQKAVVATKKAEAEQTAADLQAIKDSNATKEELQKKAQDLYDAAAKTYNDDVDAIKKKYDTTELEAALAKLNDEKATIKAKLAELEAAIPELKLAATAAKDAFAAKLAKLDAAVTAAKDVLATAEKALQDAKDAIKDAVDSGVCLHNGMKVTVFGNTFCAYKAAGQCDHGDKCCANVNTSAIANTIKGYVQAGDFQALKSEAQNIYNQLNNPAVEGIVSGMIESAVDAKANEYLGAENWSALKDLANQMMTPGELENMVNQAVAKLSSQIDSAINSALNGNPAALESLKAKINELKAHFGDIDLDASEIEAKLVQAAKNYLNSAKNEIAAMIAAAKDKVDQEKIEAAINNAVAALRNLDNAEIKAAVEKFVSELKSMLEDKFGGSIDQTKAEIEAMIQSALNSECAQHIADKAAALKAAIEAKLAEVHLCEKSVEQIAQEVQTLIAEYEDDIATYLEQKAAALIAKLEGLDLSDMTEAEVKALISKAVTYLKNLAKDKLSAIHAILSEILGHTRTVMPAVAPDCINTGLTEGLKCVCGYVLIEQETIPANGIHNFVNGVCTVCGAKDPNYVEPSNPTQPPVVPPVTPCQHNYQTVKEQAATCTEAGHVWEKCFKCGATQDYKTADALGHSYSWVVVEQPSAKADGKSIYVCANCGDIANTKVIKYTKYYYNNTMTSFGPTTRELVGGNDWYRVTPVDVTVDGIYTYDLVASNRYVVGTVTIKVESGVLTVSYDVDARPCTVKNEVLKIYASKADLALGNAVEATIGTGINIADTFGADTKVIVSMILTGDYDTVGYNVTDFVVNDATIAAMIANMD